MLENFDSETTYVHSDGTEFTWTNIDSSEHLEPQAQTQLLPTSTSTQTPPRPLPIPSQIYGEYNGLGFQHLLDYISVEVDRVIHPLVSLYDEGSILLALAEVLKAVTLKFSVVSEEYERLKENSTAKYGQSEEDNSHCENNITEYSDTELHTAACELLVEEEKPLHLKKDEENCEGELFPAVYELQELLQLKEEEKYISGEKLSGSYDLQESPLNLTQKKEEVEEEVILAAESLLFLKRKKKKDFTNKSPKTQHSLEDEQEITSDSELFENGFPGFDDDDNSHCENNITEYSDTELHTAACEPLVEEEKPLHLKKGEKNCEGELFPAVYELEETSLNLTQKKEEVEEEVILAAEPLLFLKRKKENDFKNEPLGKLDRLEDENQQQHQQQQHSLSTTQIVDQIPPPPANAYGMLSHENDVLYITETCTDIERNSSGTISAANSCPTSPRQGFRDYHSYNYNNNNNFQNVIYQILPNI